ncbi:DUF4136 domain-containing protein [Galbibacter mesophilus]|uniref:DUF4136 domain-containing protein n=1 Tax=Galbibacter mesophilus TaxID=379069 RepID=UPI00191F36DE|nr:DUF4136 domain-containing protein [Galbibacter mesophilus]MCM5661745.1 DUF4136 domain-containing protein [Galbibacter mesophilus]
MNLKLITICCCFLLTACGSVQVAYDYDKKNDFSQYKSYDYYPDIQTGLSQLDEKRLFKSIDSIMETKGYENSSTPDIYINIVSASRPKPSNSSVGIGIGGTGRNMGGGISVGVPVGGNESYREITIDVIDAANDELVWQAVSEGTVSEQMTPATRNEKLKQVAEKIFSKYPPEK